MTDPVFGRGVATLWSPRMGTPENWRMWSKAGKVYPLRRLDNVDRMQAERELISQPPPELFKLPIDRSTAIIGIAAYHAWEQVGEQAVRECCYPKLGVTGTFEVGSVASIKLGRTPYNHTEIDLSKHTWHLILDQDKLADWLEIYGCSKDWLVSTEYSKRS